MSGAVFLLYITGTQYWAIIGDIVPSSRYGGVAGIVHLIANLAGILAPTVTGYVVDTTDSWIASFVLGAGICTAGALLMAIFGHIGRLEANEHGEADEPKLGPDTAG
jgi:ACS family hexuronate transporter-like MFS transporter